MKEEVFGEVRNTQMGNPYGMLVRNPDKRVIV
jgi:hypothetical protein